MKKRARVTQWYTIFGTTQQRQSKTSCNLNPLQTVMAASSWTDLFRKYMKSERPRGSQNKDTKYLHVDVDISCRIMSWPRFVDQAASHKHSKNPALNNKWSYYIHIFMYIHIFICIRYRMNMENKWTNERRQETTNGIRIFIGKHGKHLQNVRPHEKDDSDDLSHPISSSTRLQKRRNRMKQAECDECIWMSPMSTNTKASRRSRRFLLVVRIKVQPTQQEAEDANLRVSFWLVLTLPNVHRNFNRTLIRIA